MDIAAQILQTTNTLRGNKVSLLTVHTHTNPLRKIKVTILCIVQSPG